MLVGWLSRGNGRLGSVTPTHPTTMLSDQLNTKGFKDFYEFCDANPPFDCINKISKMTQDTQLGACLSYNSPINLKGVHHDHSPTLGSFKSLPLT